MLSEEHFEMLTRFRVRAMGDKLREMVEDDAYDRHAFEERMEMLMEAEASARRDRKVAKLVHEACFKLPSACVEDVVYLKDRRLSRDRVARLAACDWVEACEGRAATLIASQLEPNEWYLRIEDELMADSILNRIATGARYIDLDGPNMREYFAKRKGEL